MNTIIRSMLSEDVPYIHSLKKDYIELDWSENSFYKEVRCKKSISLVAETEDKLTGYIIAKLVINDAQILNLFVHRDFRGQGIGSLLLEALISRLRYKEIESVFLETRQNNKIAISLYENFGFKQVAIRKDYYIKPSDNGVLMLMLLH